VEHECHLGVEAARDHADGAAHGLRGGALVLLAVAGDDDERLAAVANPIRGRNPRRLAQHRIDAGIAGDVDGAAHVPVPPQISRGMLGRREENVR
jgi:hypothetical protein